MWETFVNRLQVAAEFSWTVIVVMIVYILATADSPMQGGAGEYVFWATLLLAPYYIIKIVAWILHSFD